MRLILASASPRRAELLTRAGIDYEVAATTVDETPFDGEDPIKYVLRLAREKATACAATSNARGAAVLAADTAVVAGGELLGKPVNAADARRMLEALSGRIHAVHTGVVLLAHGQAVPEVATSRVRFVELSAAEISWYIRTGEPEGKAGAYAIQGLGSRYVDWIEGSWSNIVGLPVAATYRMLTGSGVIS
jgi:septum formation protein